jgi:hypothetical protein
MTAAANTVGLVVSLFRSQARRVPWLDAGGLLVPLEGNP